MIDPAASPESVLLIQPRGPAPEVWRSMTRYIERLVDVLEPEISARAIPASHFNMPAPFRAHIPRYRQFPPLPRKWSEPLDLVHFTDIYIAPHVRRFNCPRVVTVHDMMPHQFRRNWPPGEVLAQAVFRRSLRALSAVDAIVVPSATSGLALREVSPALADRIHVVPVPVPDQIGAPPAPSRRDPATILSIGTTAYYKNIELMLHTLADPALSGARLVRIGESLPSESRALAQRLGIASRIEERGFIDEEALLRALHSATVLFQPSLGEGFGMPVAEAMAAGLPVVVSDGGALPDVVGSAGRVVPLRKRSRRNGLNPADVRAMAAALSEVLQSEQLRERMSAAGLSESERFRRPAVRASLLRAYGAAIGRFNARNGA
ncbi:MAG: glycosyltransferase [Dehalococcoidia bacterium]